jgi:hypothetical protein
MRENRFPPGWDEARVRKVLAHYEEQTIRGSHRLTMLAGGAGPGISSCFWFSRPRTPEASSSWSLGASFGHRRGSA